MEDNVVKKIIDLYTAGKCVGFSMVYKIKDYTCFYQEFEWKTTSTFYCPETIFARAKRGNKTVNEVVNDIINFHEDVNFVKVMIDREITPKFTNLPIYNDGYFDYHKYEDFLK